MREVILSITCDKCEGMIDEEYAISLEIKLNPQDCSRPLEKLAAMMQKTVVQSTN